MTCPIPPSHYNLTESELLTLAVCWAERSMAARRAADLLEQGAAVCVENARRWHRRATEYLEIAQAREGT